MVVLMISNVHADAHHEVKMQLKKPEGSVFSLLQ